MSNSKFQQICGLQKHTMPTCIPLSGLNNDITKDKTPVRVCIYKYIYFNTETYMKKIKQDNLNKTQYKKMKQSFR